MTIEPRPLADDAPKPPLLLRVASVSFALGVLAVLMLRSTTGCSAPESSPSASKLDREVPTEETSSLAATSPQGPSSAPAPAAVADEPSIEPDFIGGSKMMVLPEGKGTGKTPKAAPAKGGPNKPFLPATKAAAPIFVDPEPASKPQHAVPKAQ